jgi:hypothetical protein
VAHRFRRHFPFSQDQSRQKAKAKRADKLARRRSTEGDGASLTRAIAAYRAKPFVSGNGARQLTQDDERMLDRLLASKPGQKAFAELQLDEPKGRIFISDCAKAHRYANGQHAKEVRARTSLSALSKARKKLDELSDSLLAAGLLAGCDEEISSLAMAIDNEEYYRRRWDRSLSRKGDQDAADSRAIGWVKGSVARLSGRAHLEEARLISAVVMGGHDEDVTLDDVINARTPKDWLDRAE